MLCSHPYFPGIVGTAYPCGQCGPCSKKRRRMWFSRIMLESMKHEQSSFLTLTYDDEYLPKTPDGFPTLKPRDVQLWLKRFRKEISPSTCRYYLAGEYGENTQRPHYHLALFGVGLDCESAISKTWTMDGRPMGFIQLGTLEPASANYICSYITKTGGKMTKFDDKRLDGRYPEFARMSNRPGLGASAMWDIVAGISVFPEALKLSASGEVPYVFRLGGDNYVLGRYLRTKLRELVGYEKVDPYTGEITYGVPDAQVKQIQSEVLSMYEDWKCDPKNAEKSFKQFFWLTGQISERALEVKAQNSKRRVL